jgi:hypothetical protein
MSVDPVTEGFADLLASCQVDLPDLDQTQILILIRDMAQHELDDCALTEMNARSGWSATFTVDSLPVIDIDQARRIANQTEGGIIIIDVDEPDDGLYLIRFSKDAYDEFMGAEYTEYSYNLPMGYAQIQIDRP